MKKYIASLLIAVTLPACSEPIRNPNAIIVKKDTLTHKAYYYYGLSEQKDRDLIKDIMGVDPVTTEWCAAFVNMVLLEQSYPTSGRYNDYPLMARSFLYWGDPVNEPKQGDILVFKRGSTGWQGHVGFYVSSKVVNGQIVYTVLGGNQSDAVTIEEYPGNKLLGIRRVSKTYSPVMY
jgi:uncharacterized protein (TIGR02594 family)